MYQDKYLNHHEPHSIPVSGGNSTNSLLPTAIKLDKKKKNSSRHSILEGGGNAPINCLFLPVEHIARRCVVNTSSVHLSKTKEKVTVVMPLCTVVEL